MKIKAYFIPGASSRPPPLRTRFRYTRRCSILPPLTRFGGPPKSSKCATHPLLSDHLSLVRFAPVFICFPLRPGDPSAKSSRRVIRPYGCRGARVRDVFAIRKAAARKRWESAWNSCDHDDIQDEALRLSLSPLAVRAPWTRSLWHAVRQCPWDERDGIASYQCRAINALLKRREWKGARCGEPENGDTMQGTCEDHLQPLVEWREVGQTRTMRCPAYFTVSTAPPVPATHASSAHAPSAAQLRFQDWTDARRIASPNERQGLESPRTAVAHPSRASSHSALHLATSRLHSATIFSLSLSRILAPANPISSPQPHDLPCYMLLDSSPRTTVTHLVPTTANANEILCARSLCAFAVLLAEEIDACRGAGRDMGAKSKWRCHTASKGDAEETARGGSLCEQLLGECARYPFWAARVEVGVKTQDRTAGRAGEEEQVSLPSAVRERARSREGGSADDSRRNSSVRHARRAQLHTHQRFPQPCLERMRRVFVVDGRVAMWWIAWTEIHGQ
ncbi:hypothetical protein C8R45DRAFT_947520 [Mycena sanguinolenta]|nr:hypothetical protein C8R45DRAFT_947520 [Mycena sanguinolenta]